MRHFHPHVLTLALLIAPIAASGCRGEDTDHLPTPRPTSARVAAAPLPTATITPIPSATPLPTATPIPVETPTPVALPPVLGPEDAGSAGSCEILRAPELIELTIAPWAPDEAKAAVNMTQLVFVAEVTQHDNLARQYVLKPTDPEGLPEFVLAYTGDTPPIEMGGAYTFHWNQDEGNPPGSIVLRIDDEIDVLFLSGRVKAGTEGFGGPGPSDPLMSADMGGFVVRQLPTLCQTAETDDCGFESRAAWLEAARGVSRVGRPAGETGIIPTDPPYRLTVFTSHVRRWAHASPGMQCTLPDDWPQSWRIERTEPVTEE